VWQRDTHLLESGNLAKDPSLHRHVRLVRPPLEHFPRSAVLWDERVIVDVGSALFILADAIVVEADDELAPFAHAHGGGASESEESRPPRIHAQI
jgi:hypothetical protein